MTDPNVHEILDEHGKLLRQHADFWRDQREINEETAETVRVLKEGQDRIAAKLGDVPTVAELERRFADQRAHFDGAINGLLRDAIKATPAEAADRQVQATKAGNVWLAVAAVAAVCGLVVSLLVATVTITARNEQRVHAAASQ